MRERSTADIRKQAVRVDTENTSNGNSVAAYDTVTDPEDTDNDVAAFARFMRATKAPPRDGLLANTPDALVGAVLFNQVGGAICHTRTLRNRSLHTTQSFVTTEKPAL
jgi:hypothetical protein